MAFKAAFLAYAPDAETEKHQCVIKTTKYKLFVRVIKDQAQALEACQNLIEKEKIDVVHLCPGFTHQTIAAIVEAVGNKVGVFVARGDGPSNTVSLEARRREGWV